MSFSIFIQKFKSGEPAAIELDEFSRVIAEFGQVQKTEFGLEIISSVGEMYETASLSEEGENGISGIAFHRPTDNTLLKELIFKILKFEGTCFFDQDLDYLQFRNLSTQDLPVDLIENAEQGAIEVTNSKEVWPLEE